ncbi:MAG: hypothetical protein LBD11_03705 [Candidatus Peribacteria bacterium]|jgi:hypothetical protein|nr:hypothetical protein [Candidatus Peribacteria bacterium]
MYDKKGGTHKENIMYAVKYNPQRKTFTVRGEFNDYIKGDKAKHYQLDPKHEMDYNSFMMFISEKNLKPWKKDEAEQLVEDQNQQNMTLFNKKEFKINRFTPLTIWKGIKAKRKELNDKLGEREKNSQKQFENLLVDDL